jgi:hypothetical protein
MRFFLYIISFVLLSSCKMEAPKTEETSTTESLIPLTNEAEFAQMILEIDAKEGQLDVGNSLFYTNNDQSTEEVFAYLNKQGEILKMEEKFYDATTGNRGIRLFYFLKEKKFASIERFIDKKDAEGKFVGRVSYYNKNQQPIFSKARLADYEEDLENAEFKQIAPFDCSMLTARQVLNQQGLFKTTFQGFLSDGPVDYLLVGGTGEKGYTSAIVVQFEDDQLAYLKKNQQTMVNTPLMVEYEKMIDQGNYEYQILLKARILSE